MIPSRFVYPSPGFQVYWNEGKGRQLLSELDKLPSREEIEALVPKLFEWDTLADAVIEDLYLKEGYHKANSLVDSALEIGISDQHPECLKNLIEAVNTKPNWLNPDKVAMGSEFCRRSGVTGMIVLRNYSLMGGYESAAINKPLIYTEALKKGAAKRIAETTEFWVNITGDDALNPKNIGFKHIVKVRLMHAYARVSILKSSDWKQEDWGTPINTWDMVATNLGFSIIYLDGLRVMGIHPTTNEEEGLFHFWKYVGFLLGIPPELIPETRKEAIAEIYKWTITQPPADDDTKELANSLYLEPLGATYLKFKWQRNMVKGINLSYNSYFLGRLTSKTIGIPYSRWRFYPYIIRFFNQLSNSIALSSDGLRKSSARRRRKRQENIKKIMLVGFQSIMDQTPRNH